MALPADYESRSAGEKRDLLWAELAGAPYADGPLPRFERKPPPAPNERRGLGRAFGRKGGARV